MRIYCIVFLVAYALMNSCNATPGTSHTRPAVFAVTAKGEGNKLTASAQGNTTVFDVYSWSGIGSGAVEFVSGEPPKNIVIRLHLKGLEEFRLSYKETVIVASKPSDANSKVIQRLISPEGNEQSISSDSPFWMEIKEINDQAIFPYTSESGYFEITMPEELIWEAYRSFSMLWIDFFR